MLKHIKPRDILQFLLLGIAVIALLLICSLENAPLPVLLWTLVPLAIVLWAAWFIMLALERKKRAETPKLKMMHNGQWHDVVEVEYVPQRRDFPIYDQDNDPQDRINYKENI